MSPAIRFLLILVALTALASLAPAAETEARQNGVSGETLQEFVREYRVNPGALDKLRDELRDISPEQMRDAVRALDTTHFTYLYPLTIPGEDFSRARGEKLERLSLMAVRGGQLRPVPFQFDQYDQEGLIWIEGVSRNDLLGERGKLSDHDELVFMFRDGGRQAWAPEEHGTIEGDILHEIELQSPHNAPRYLYLVRDNPERSDVRYVDVDEETGRVRTTVMEMDFNPRNLADIGFIASRFGPHAGENVFDSIHLELSTGILNRNLRVRLDTDSNIRAQPRAVHSGPVRSTMLLRARIWYFGLPTVFRHDFNVQFYEQGIVIPTQFAIESMGALRYLVGLLRDPEMELSVDFRNLEDARVTFDAVYSERERGIVDGYMSPFEEKMNLARMPGDWLHLDSRRGWNLFFVNRVPVTEGGLFDSFLDGTRLNMVYRDDPEDTLDHQRFRGADPRLGYATKGLPEPALDLLRAMPRMPGRVNTLGEAILYMEERARTRGALDNYDKATRGVLEELVEAGKLDSVETLANAFLYDMGRMRFVGLDQDELRELMRDAMLKAIDDPADVRHGKVLTALVALAEERDIDLRRLRFATMENALWFPVDTGEYGPRGFYREVRNPPRYRIGSPEDNAAPAETPD